MCDVNNLYVTVNMYLANINLISCGVGGGANINQEASVFHKMFSSRQLLLSSKGWKK